MTLTKTKAKVCGSLITLWFLSQICQVNEMTNCTYLKKQLFAWEQTDEIKWELLKYEICKFVITYSKKISQNNRRSQSQLEKN